MPNKLAEIGSALGEGIMDFGTYSARAAIQANNVSAASQAAQGAFNQASADNANLINQGNMGNQWGFNSAMMREANNINVGMWDRAAEWNEEMWERQAKFNAEQAQIQRDWSERMENTRYQRAIKDMESAGLNPILAVGGGGSGISTGAGSGTAASVGGAQMSSASAQMASGGLLGANSASEGNYTGQMEYLSGIMGLLSAGISGLGTAFSSFGNLGDFGKGLGEALTDAFGGLFGKGSYNGLMKKGEKGITDKTKIGGKEIWYPETTVDYTVGKWFSNLFK